MIVLMAGIALVGLSRLGSSPDGVEVIDHPMPVIKEADPRGPAHLMLDSGLRMLQDSDSFRFMYTSGAAWTAGEFVAPDRARQRVILGRGGDAPEREIQRIGDAVWIRGSASELWKVTPNWSTPADPIVLADRITTLGKAVSGVRLGPTISEAETPSGDKLPVHTLLGRIEVDALTEAGLHPSGPVSDGVEVRFNMLIAQDSGLPVQLVVHGIPPAHAPLVVLHVFDYNSLEAGSIVEPENALGPSGDSSATGGGDVTSTAPIEETEPSDAPVASSSAVASGQPSEQQVEGYKPSGQRAADIYFDKTAADASGWVRYVLPTEGYSIAAPSDWTVSAGREGAEAVAGRLAGIYGAGSEDGSRWGIYRMAQRGAVGVGPAAGRGDPRGPQH